MFDVVENASLEELVGIVANEAGWTFKDVFCRCRALERLSAYGEAAIDALPAVMRSLTVPLLVDCHLALRVAAAEAVWKIGQRGDLALPFLAWALKDEYWGVSRKAVEVLTDMGGHARDAIPDLVSFAQRRLDGGPFYYERHGFYGDGKSLLAIVATALGNCGRCVEQVDAARRMLNRIVDCEDPDARTAAQQALQQLKEESLGWKTRRSPGKLDRINTISEAALYKTLNRRRT